jgi:hypothetical protein
LAISWALSTRIGSIEGFRGISKGKHNTAHLERELDLEFGKNETSSQSLVWRFTQRNGTRIRVCSLLGEFSVWQEGGSERELFRIN